MNKPNLRYLLLLAVILSSSVSAAFSGNGTGDSLLKNRQRCLIIGGYAGLAQPGGDLSSDYGSIGEAGGSIQLLTKTGFLLGLEGGFLFGGNVKKDPIPNLRNPDGTVSGTDGNDAVFKVFQRGSLVPVLRIGYRIPQQKPWIRGNQLGGITICGGSGWLRHYTYIQDLSKKTPQFSDNYRIGYDRLATGLFSGLWLGYLYLADHGRINLHFEMGYGMGFTKTARYSFVDGSPAGQSRRDDLFQLRLKLCFAVKSRAENTVYFY